VRLDLQVGSCVRGSEFVLMNVKNTHKANGQCFTGHGMEFSSSILITEEVELKE
jgi:hypothetical protein